MVNFWHTFFFNPIYNTLVFFIDIVPGGDVGLAIILTILLVKTILLPLSIKAVKTQKAIKEIEPKIKEIKEKYKDDKQQQSLAIMEVYKEAGVNPLASIFLMFLQIPIIIALYFAVYKGGGVVLPDINTDILYSFIAVPQTVAMHLFGVIDITGRSLVLAVGAGITQYWHTHLTMPAPPPKKEGEEPNIKDDLMRNMHTQMKYVMPVLIAFIAYSISSVIALYFLVSNLVTIAQEYFIIKKHR